MCPTENPGTEEVENPRIDFFMLFTVFSFETWGNLLLGTTSASCESLPVAGPSLQLHTYM